MTPREQALQSRVAELQVDAERYNWLRRMQVRLSLSNDTVATLLADVTSLDSAIKDAKAWE